MPPFFVLYKPREARPTARSSIAQQGNQSAAAAGEPSEARARTQARAQARAREERARRGGRAKVAKRARPTRTARGWRDERSEARQNAANGGGAERAGRRAVGCPCGAPTFCLRMPIRGPLPRLVTCPVSPLFAGAGRVPGNMLFWQMRGGATYTARGFAQLPRCSES